MKNTKETWAALTKEEQSKVTGIVREFMQKYGVNTQDGNMSCAPTCEFPDLYPDRCFTCLDKLFELVDKAMALVTDAMKLAGKLTEE